MIEVIEFEEIVSIETCENEDVFDLTVDENHNFFANDLLVHNCSELVLSAYDSCRLLLVNAYKFVKDAFLPSASFDFDAFAVVSTKAQRLMDDLVDLELESIDKIIRKIKSDPEPEDVKRSELELWYKIRGAAASGRRTGLGLTAVGDTLAALGIQYGTEKSIEMTEAIYKALCLSAYRSTVQLAKEREPFPAYDYELERNHPFIKRVMAEDPHLDLDYRQYGRRNIALTTTAPAGSVSTLTQTTSGIEPAFMLSYKRRKKINPNDAAARVDFVDQSGDKWQEYVVYHHAFKKWMETTGKTEADIEQSPYWHATSNDIDWNASVRLQAAAQKWVCHAISKTVNVPNSATRENIADIYMTAWESGCKGITVYRDGCRTGVLVSVDEKKEDDRSNVKLVETHAPKRPKELKCDIHRVVVKGASYTVFVGLLDNKPYEVFAGLSEHVEVPKKAKNGLLIKNGKNKDGVVTYNVKIPIGDDDSVMFKDIVNLFDNATHGAFTRTISLALRHGVPVQYVVEQLQKDKASDMQSFSRVISRVLKGYIPDGAALASKCESCGGSLKYQEGCVLCVQCGWSKCG